MQFTNLTQSTLFKTFAQAMLGILLCVTVFAPIAMVGQATVVAIADAQTKPADPAATPASTPASAPSPAATAAAAQPGAQPTTNDDLGCSLLNFSICLSNILYVFVVNIPLKFAYITANIFNFGVQLALNSSSYALDFLSQGWAIVRDIANLAFIFILIYIAYTIIIEAETAGTMRALAAVVVMALLINFSFFLTRVVIDAGNILAVQFYNAIQVKDVNNQLAPLVASPIGGNNQPALKDLTAGIMNASKVQSLLSVKSFQDSFKSSGFLTNLGSLALVYIAMGVLLALLGFVFLIVGIKFLVRVVILWLVIIASPLAFAAHALPGNKKINSYYKLWLNYLIQSSFYPAVFLFLFYIVTLFTNALGGKNGLIGDVFQANSSFVSAIINTSVRVGFVIVLLYFAMKFSDKFASESGAAMNSVVSWAGNRTASASGWALRNTAGRGANALSRNASVQNFAANSAFGRPVMASLKGVAGSSLDARGISGLRSVAGKAGINLNNAPKTSFMKKVEDRAKNVEARAKELNGDSNDIRTAQKAYESQYDKDHGTGAYAARIKTLAQAKKDADALAKTAKEAGNKEISKQATAEAKKAEEKMKDMTGAGKKEIDRLNDERKARFISRLDKKYWANAGIGPSRGTIEGVAKVRGGKNKVDEAFEHLKHALHDENGHDDAADHADPAHTPATPTAGADPHHPLTASAARATEQGIGFGEADRRVLDKLGDIVDRLKEQNRLVEGTNASLSSKIGTDTSLASKTERDNSPRTTPGSRLGSNTNSTGSSQRKSFNSNNKSGDTDSDGTES